MRWFRVFATAVMLLPLGACSLLSTTPQEYAQVSQAFWRSNISPVRRVWSHYVGVGDVNTLCLLPTLSIANHLVFTAHAKTVTALDMVSGRVLWHVRLAENVISGLSVRGSALYVVSRMNHVYVLDIRTGRVKQTISFELHGRVGRPLLSEDLIFLRSQSGEIEARNRLTGQHVWHFIPNESLGRDFSGLTTVSAWSCDSMTIYQGHLFTMDALGHVWSLDIKTGSIEWHAVNPRSAQAALMPNTVESPVGAVWADDHTVCSALLSGGLRCFQYDTSEATPFYTISAVAPLTPSGNAGAQSYILRNGSRIEAIRFGKDSTQDRQWSRQLPFDDVYTTPVVWGPFVVSASENGKLVFLLKDSGVIDYIDSVNVGIVHASPLTSANEVFLLTDQGWLVAYRRR